MADQDPTPRNGRGPDGRFAKTDPWPPYTPAVGRCQVPGASGTPPPEGPVVVAGHTWGDEDAETTPIGMALALELAPTTPAT